MARLRFRSLYDPRTDTTIYITDSPYGVLGTVEHIGLRYIVVAGETSVTLPIKTTGHEAIRHLKRIIASQLQEMLNCL